MTKCPLCRTLGETVDIKKIVPKNMNSGSCPIAIHPCNDISENSTLLISLLNIVKKEIYSPNDQKTVGHFQEQVLKPYTSNESEFTRNHSNTILQVKESIEVINQQQEEEQRLLHRPNELGIIQEEKDSSEDEDLGNEPVNLLDISLTDTEIQNQNTKLTYEQFLKNHMREHLTISEITQEAYCPQNLHNAETLYIQYSSKFNELHNNNSNKCCIIL